MLTIEPIHWGYIGAIKGTKYPDFGAYSAVLVMRENGTYLIASGMTETHWLVYGLPYSITKNDVWMEIPRPPDKLKH